MIVDQYLFLNVQSFKNSLQLNSGEKKQHDDQSNHRQKVSPEKTYIDNLLCQHEQIYGQTSGQIELKRRPFRVWIE